MADGDGQVRLGGIRVVVSDLVPEGRNVVRVELQTETLIVTRPGKITDLADDMNRHLAEAIQHGRLIRGNDPVAEPQGHPDI